jgi:uncharacterized protein YdeI (BOF family)
MLRSISLAAALVFLGLAGCGCNNNPPAPKPNAAAGHEDHGHSHAAKGPHMGSVIALGAEEYHAEFVWDDASGKVTVYLLDKDIKSNPAAASSQETITIEGKMKEETKTYTLAAVNRTSGDMPTATQFEVDDKELVSLLETLGGNNSATLTVKIGDKEFAKQNINFDDHGHAHE